MKTLKAKIESLPRGPLADKDFQHFLVSLITSPAVGHPKHWAPVMQTLIGHLPVRCI